MKSDHLSQRLLYCNLKSAVISLIFPITISQNVKVKDPKFMTAVEVASGGKLR